MRFSPALQSRLLAAPRCRHLAASFDSALHPQESRPACHRHRPPAATALPLSLPSSARRCFGIAVHTRSLPAIEQSVLWASRFCGWCPTTPSPAFRSVSARGLTRANLHPQPSAATRQTAFTKLIFFQSVNLPFLRLQRTRVARCARGQSPSMRLCGRSRKAPMSGAGNQREGDKHHV